MSDWYQKKKQRENRAKIIQLLAEEPLTFKELIDKSDLSRGTVHRHLKKLGNLIVKKYDSGKILNVLQVQKLNLVEWFLDQFRALEVPIKILNKGRDLLDAKTLALSMSFYYGKVFYDLRLIDEIRLKNVKGTEIPHTTKTMLAVSKAKRTHVVFNIKDVRKKPEWKGHRQVIRELTPLTFHIAMDIYYWEKVASEKAKEKSTIFAYSYLDETSRKGFNKALLWWGEVSDYVPGATLISILTTNYFNTLLLNKKKLEELYARDDCVTLSLRLPERLL